MSTQHVEDRGLLRFLTCGSVDDGKSTLIGRLLVDSRAVLQDQLASVSRSGETDLARETLEQLTLAFEAPDSLRQRAQIALSVLGPAPAAPETPADGVPAPAPSEGETK